VLPLVASTIVPPGRQTLLFRANGGGSRQANPCGSPLDSGHSHLDVDLGGEIAGYLVQPHDGRIAHGFW